MHRVLVGAEGRPRTDSPVDHYHDSLLIRERK